MDFLKMIEEKIALLKSNIESLQFVLGKTEEPEKMKSLTDEILKQTKELGKAEAALENEKARQNAAMEQAKSLAVQTNAGVQNVTPKIVVGTPASYKTPFMPGVEFNMKKEIDLVKRSTKLVSVKESFADESRAELVTKFFIDLIAKGYAQATSPMAAAMAYKAALAEGSDTTGGSLRSDEVRAELIAYVRDASIALQDANVVQMNSDILTYPKELTGVSVGYGAEADEASETESTYIDVTLTARKMHAYSISSNEMIMDCMINGGIVAVLMPQFIEAVGQKVDSTVFIGSGADSAVFSGIFKGVAGYSTVFGTSSAAFSMLLESDIRKILAKVPERYLAGNGKWYMNQSVLYNNFAGLQDSNERPLFYDSLGGPGMLGKMLAGYPVRCPTQTPSTSAASTVMAVIANLKAVLIGERLSNIDLLVNPYTLAKKSQTEFILFTRWGYALALANMIGSIKTSA